MINSIDLFAGCGGLLTGVEHTGRFRMLAGAEWETAPVTALVRNLKDSFGMDDSDRRIVRFDIQKSDELFSGWKDDPDYGTSDGMDRILAGSTPKVIIGGPPCQAYSIAGRVRDENGMRNDYRNYLFEAYIRVVNHYRPDAFVFENVPGILSAKPGDGSRKIIYLIQEEFEKAGYAVLGDLSKAVVDMTQYGVPQNRSRVIILGLSKEKYGERCESILTKFYTEYLPKYRSDKVYTVRDAIADLPKLYPLREPLKWNGRKLSHGLPDPFVENHVSRFHSARDIKLFRMLCEDIQSGANQYKSVDSLKRLYTKVTGKESNVHKYHVLEWDSPSNLIPAHLYKDGLRHIHPDPDQARSITVREAARIQTFPDSYVFPDSMTDAYRMIGNAVPPRFAECLGNAVADLIENE